MEALDLALSQYRRVPEEDPGDEDGQEAGAAQDSGEAVDDPRPASTRIGYSAGP